MEEKHVYSLWPKTFTKAQLQNTTKHQDQGLKPKSLKWESRILPIHNSVAESGRPIAVSFNFLSITSFLMNPQFNLTAIHPKIRIKSGTFDSGNCPSSYMVWSSLALGHPTLVTRSLHLDHTIPTPPHHPSPFPHIHTHHTNTWYLSSFLNPFQAHAFCSKVIKWMILTNNSWFYER